MKALHFDACDPREFEAWRMALANSLREALSPETTVEFLTYRDSQVQEIRRFVNIYRGLTKTKIEVMYPEHTGGNQ